MPRQCQPEKWCHASSGRVWSVQTDSFVFSPTARNNKRSGRTIFKNRGNVLSPLAELLALFFFLWARSQVRWRLNWYWAPQASFPLPSMGLTSEMAAELSKENGTVMERSYSMLALPRSYSMLYMSVQGEAEAWGKCELHHWICSATSWYKEIQPAPAQGGPLNLAVWKS